MLDTTAAHGADHVFDTSVVIQIVRHIQHSMQAVRTSLLITILGLLALSNLFSEEKIVQDLTQLSGIYTFNFSDTDEDAVVSVQFRRNKEQHGITDWLADGKMEDRIRKRKVTFSGAYVAIKQNGEVIVDAEFVRFKLTGKRLDWLPGHKHPLFKEAR